MKIDLNCDMGESFGNYTIGKDLLLMPYLSSCNIACGFHGGDAYHIERTIDAALEHRLRIGAHPSYPDLQGFGRRKMFVPHEELTSIIKYQVSALKGLVESKGGRLSYVKPHGALYNSIAYDQEEAAAVIRGILSIDSSLQLMVLADAPIADVAQLLGISTIREGFADRRYEHNTKLQSRSIPGSIYHDAQIAIDQVQSLAHNQTITWADGSAHALHVESICIHGDNPVALEIARGAREVL